MGDKYKAALYIRVSTEEQASEGHSANAQIETLTKYCSLYDIEIFDIYKDLGISGKETKNRTELKRMLLDAKMGCFNLVLVWKISRLSRSLKDLLLILDSFEKAGIVFSSYSEKFDTSTAVGRMTLQLLGSIAEFERNTIVDNVKLGLQEYARRGGKTGTVLGYDSCNKQLLINPWEAEAIKLIYNLYTVKRLSMSGIAEYMNALGCRTKRNHSFTKAGISVILSNPVYIGINRHKIGQKEVYCIKGSHTPIIEEEVWKKAQELKVVSKSKRPARNKQYNFLLSGKIKCPSCGSLMYSFTSGTAAKAYRYYRCKGCKSICKAESVEEAVLKRLKERMKDENFLNKMPKLLQPNNAAGINHINTELHKKELERTQRLLDKYILLMDNEAFNSSEVIISKIKMLELRLRELQSLIDTKDTTAENNNSLVKTSENYIEIVNQILNQNDASKVKIIIDTFVEFITLSSNREFKEISFRIDKNN